MTITPIKERRYSYNKLRKGVQFLVFLYLMYVYVMIFYALFDVFQVDQIVFDEEFIAFAFFPLVFFILWILFFSIFPVLVGISVPDIRVTDKGLFIQAFFFLWIFVSWEDVLEIRPQYRISILRKKAAVVLVRKLTPFHWLIGMLRGKLRPGFQISHSINGYEELIDLIQRKIEQNSEYS